MFEARGGGGGEGSARADALLKLDCAVRVVEGLKGVER